jgi:hypothetical protein
MAIPVHSHPVTDDEIDRVTETLTLAFLHDPVWSVALARPDGSTAHHAAYWRQFVEGSLRYSTVFSMDDESAVSVWIPPGGTELSAAQEETVVRLIEGVLQPSSVRAMRELWERFESNHPRHEPRAFRRRRRSGLPGVDESRERPSIRTRGLPADRRLRGRHRWRPDRDDVAPGAGSGGSWLR